MQAEDGIDGEPVEDPLLHHAERAADVLLGGLEDEMHGAVEIAVGREVVSQPNSIVV